MSRSIGRLRMWLCRATKAPVISKTGRRVADVGVAVGGTLTRMTSPKKGSKLGAVAGYIRWVAACCNSISTFNAATCAASIR